MFYEKNKAKELDLDLFRNPTCEYRGAPFWAWNCELKQDELLWQMEVLKRMGFGGGHMHVRTGMATPYLSDEYMELIRGCVEKAKAEKMLAYLYDEDRWPSGAAGGLVTKDPKYRARYLLFTGAPYEEQEADADDPTSTARASRTGNGKLVACYDVELDAQGCLKTYRLIEKDEKAKGAKWYAYLETPQPSPWYNNQTYINTLDKAAMDRFIEVTYEAYNRTIRSDFGKTVPSIFTDEPQFTHETSLAYAAEECNNFLPWTDDICESFAKEYPGEDLLASLPEIFWELPEGKTSLIRYHYHDHVAQRFTEAFADNCGKWCDDHGLMLTGHMLAEESLASQSATLGEAMRAYRSFGLPGIDMLCAAFEFTTAKQTQSAVHQYGREGMLSELYGVTSWAFDFRGHKLHGDWQAALGVTVRVPHLAWVSMGGEAKRDYPASINYQSPWWKEYSYVEDHFARVNTAMTRGKPLVRVGMVHPIESYWLHMGPTDQTGGIRQQMDVRFHNITEWLLKGAIDFDFICESLLPELCEKGGAPLQVGKMAYDVIIVPGCETLRSTTLERLEAFRKAGGRLIFLGDAPTLADAVPSERGKKLFAESEQVQFAQTSVLDALEDVRLLDWRAENSMNVRSHNYAPGDRVNNLLHQFRQDNGCKWLFISHCEEPFNKDVSFYVDTKLIIKGLYTPSLYNTINGTVEALPYTYENGCTVIRRRLFAYDSLLIRLDEKETAPAPIVAEPKRIASPIAVPAMVDYELDEPNVLLMDTAEFKLDDEPYHAEEEILRADNVCREKLGWPTRKEAVAQPWVIQKEPSVHTFTLRFTVESEIAVDGALLALEEANDAEISVNGAPLEKKIVGWWTDKSISTVAMPHIEPGKTVIEIAWPFGKRTNPEWCYLLGAFGVRVRGRQKMIVALPKQLGFDNIVTQDLPFYGGNITYQFPFETKGGDLHINVPHYAGAMMRAEIDGVTDGYEIVYPPYCLDVKGLAAGKHEFKLTLFGNRQNCFGPVHLADETVKWIGPGAWRSEDDSWTYEYRLQKIGVTTSPIFTEA